ncbi:TPA: single-stranded-DNA-specific exonuclease RecJ [Candidatus Avigastranaerophilus faecigallinarum]|nr:single-stranded-DNA-specific exonuclease RecJ [Candidatus Avigastranaerophilus faecigallinarum]
MSVRKVWKTKDNVVSDDIIKSCNGNKVLATLLVNRGIDTVEKITKFLNPLKVKLSSPDVFLDMEKSVNRIKTAIEKNEHITVYGDFDADGVTSTALLYMTLKEIGANVDFYLPDRSSESHGLNTKALVKIIAKRKSKLIITVDCGISNVSEVNFAKGFNTDIIITDHHEAPEILPDSYAILNPKAPNSIDSSLDIDEIQSLNFLAGVGVAFKLACRLLEEYNKENFVHEILPLAAVGTIGDVVELMGENRSIVEMGLELIRNGKHKGIQKLLKASSIENINLITSDNIAFGIVPRLNAAGRLESPLTAIKVLISQDEEELDKTVKLLSDLNIFRQQLCDETFCSAKQMYQNNLNENKKSIVLFDDNWHIGIIGIVASKLVEEFNKPVFLMTRDANFSNIIRCSCRSIKDLNVHSILSEHKEKFEGFGGHKMAAGFSFDENKISFEAFKKELNKTIEEHSQNINFKEIVIDADMEIDVSDITVDTVNLIDKLQPFGAANPSPLFVLKNAKLNNFKMMGQNNNHLKMYISKNNSECFDCVKWNYPDFNLPINSELDILFSLKLNTFNNITNVQLMIEDIHSELLNKKENLSEIKILDHRNKKNILVQVIDFILSTKKSTAIYIENPTLIAQLKLPDEIENKLFTIDNIPSNIEQLMFFDVPISKDNFIKIINDTNAKLIHLMNFNISELGTESFISKFSGMLKYSLSNLNGQIDTNRAAKALCVNEETVECALTLLEESEMIDLNKIDETTFKISYLHPVELSKIKQHELFFDLKENILNINAFRSFYLNTPIDEIKETILC